MLAVQVTAILFGVEDQARARKFYGQGLGCAIKQDYPNFVSFNLVDGSSSLAFYGGRRRPKMPGLLRGTRVPGVSFHYIVPSSEAVDEVMASAAAAGGEVVRQPAASQFGYFGYFSDPDGHLWKVASPS